MDIVTVQELSGHSTVTVMMRYTHTNLENKRAAVEKLGRFGDNLVTVRPVLQQGKSRLSLNRRVSYNLAGLVLEGWVSG